MCSTSFCHCFKIKSIRSRIFIFPSCFRKKRVNANMWCLLVFIFWDLFFAFWIAYFIVCPCCQPFDILNPNCGENPLCPHPPCVRKCCPEGEAVFRKDNKTVCLSSNSSFSLSNIPRWINSTLVFVDDSELKETNRFHVISFGLCSEMYKLDPTDDIDRHALLEDGRILLISSNEVVGIRDYCLESVEESNTTDVFQCFYPPNPNELNAFEQNAFPAGMSISLLFLLLTVLVYFILTELQNLHGKCAFCHVVSLSVAYVFLILVQTEVVLPGSHREGCDLCVVGGKLHISQISVIICITILFTNH